MNVFSRILTFGRLQRKDLGGRDRSPSALLKYEAKFEAAERRRMLDGDPIDVGIVYVEQDLGGDDHGDTFTLTFQGGADGTQLKEVVIDGDQNQNGKVDEGDMIFDISGGGLGADQFHNFQIVSNSGVGKVTYEVVDGGTKLILRFEGFDAGDKLTFSIDVDEVDKWYGGSVENINEGIDPIASGVEFQDTIFQTTFAAPGYYNATGETTFQNAYDNALKQSGLNLPADNFEGKRDRSDGAFDELVQEALPIRISGTVYHDRDHDVRQDAGEEGIKDVTLTLQIWNATTGQWENIPSGGKGTTTTKTDANGDYEFGYNLDLKPGRYRIIETQPTAFEISTGASPGSINGVRTGATDGPNIIRAIDITMGGTESVDNDFGEAKLATISGHVYHDRDNDGVRDAGEEPIAGVMIRIIPVDTVTPQDSIVVYTDANGFFQATGLSPGTYRIVEVQPDGWIDGKDTLGTVNGAASGAKDGNDKFKEIVLTSGSAGVNYDFGELKPAEIHGNVSRANRDGDCFAEGYENRPVAGVLIELFDGQGNLIASTRTDANGDYAFVGLTPGKYSIVEHTPKGYIDSGERAGTVDGQKNGTVSDDRISDIVLGSGDVGVHYDFCEKVPATLSGHVYVDNNLSKDFDSGDKVLAGVKVDLFDQNGNLVASTVTDANGYYEFTGLAKGMYSVVEHQPKEYLDWYDQAGTIDGKVVGVAVNPNGDVIKQISLGYGEHSVDNDFGEVPPSSISGRVHADRDGDCDYEPEEGDILLAGVKIELLDAQGNVLATTYTDAKGEYKFDNLLPGQYQIRETQPAGYLQGGVDAGSLGGVEGKDLISEIVVGVGQDGVRYDFCERFPASIDGWVWLDLDRGCDWDSGEPAIAGVQITLYDANGNVVATTFTDASGYYKFSGLVPGTYTLVERQPDGYLQGCTHAGSHGGDDSVADVISKVTLTNGDEAVHYDFAERIGDFIPPPPPTPEPPAPAAPAPFLEREEVSIPNPQLTPQLPPIDPYIPVSYTWHLSLVDAGDPRGEDGGPDTVFSNVSARGTDIWSTRRANLGRWSLMSGEGPEAADAASRQILFGVDEGIPVVGDFDGDGKDEIGVFSKGEWFLDLDGDGQWTPSDVYATLGKDGDLPVVGDWDGDGKDDIGIYGPQWEGDTRAIRVEPGLPDAENQFATERAKNVPPTAEQATDGRRELQATEGGRVRADLIDHVFAFGSKGEVPLAADWNGDGVGNIGSFVDGKWTLDSDGDGRLTSRDAVHQFGQTGDLPVVGDWDGDGVPQLGVYRGGQWILDSNNNHEIDAVDRIFESGGPDEMPVAGDWNGDGVDEVGTYRPDSIRTASAEGRPQA